MRSYPKNPHAVILGRIGGAKKTPLKKQAAIKNGKLGGRPQKQNMKKINNQVRQGDVLITPCDTVPATAVQQPATKKIVVALGEVTGHHHAIETDQADYWKDTESSDQFVEIKEPGTMTHEDHKPPLPMPVIKQPRRVILQRQFSPELSRRVKD